MIGTIDIKINAASPNLPLKTLFAFVNSPSSLRIIDVPRKIGKWKITGVSIKVTYPDNTTKSTQCVLVGGCYVGTIQGSNTAGKAANGYYVLADGIDENGEEVTGYVLGNGDVVILDSDTRIFVDDKAYYLHLFEEIPDDPREGDVIVADGRWKIFHEGGWQDFANAVNWGDIQGTLSNQSDLKDALDNKQDLIDYSTPIQAQSINVATQVTTNTLNVADVRNINSWNTGETIGSIVDGLSSSIGDKADKTDLVGTKIRFSEDAPEEITIAGQIEQAQYMAGEAQSTAARAEEKADTALTEIQRIHSDVDKKRDYNDLNILEPVNEHWVWTSDNAPEGFCEYMNSYGSEKPFWRDEEEYKGWQCYVQKFDYADGVSPGSSRNDTEVTLYFSRMDKDSFSATATRQSATDTTPTDFYHITTKEYVDAKIRELLEKIQG